MFNKILSNNRWQIWDNLKEDDHQYYVGTNAAIEVSCFFSNSYQWLFRYIMFVPYIFRSIRLNLIWGMQKIYYEHDDVQPEDENYNPLMQSFNGRQKGLSESKRDSNAVKPIRQRIVRKNHYFIK